MRRAAVIAMSLLAVGCGDDDAAIPCAQTSCPSETHYCEINVDEDGNESGRCRESWDPEECASSTACEGCVGPNDSCGCSCDARPEGAVWRCVPVAQPCGG